MYTESQTHTSVLLVCKRAYICTCMQACTHTSHRGAVWPLGMWRLQIKALHTYQHTHQQCLLMFYWHCILYCMWYSEKLCAWQPYSIRMLLSEVQVWKCGRNCLALIVHNEHCWTHKCWKFDSHPIHTLSQFTQSLYTITYHFNHFWHTT